VTAKSKSAQKVKSQKAPSQKIQPELKYQYDVIVIGTGPGGEGAAMNLTKAGKKVAVIEKHNEVGGGCTHWGTIPSKALRHSVSRLIEYNSNPLFNSPEKAGVLTFDSILKHTTNVINDQVKLRGGFYNRNDVDIYHGAASFVDANTLKIVLLDGSVENVTAEKFVIASGSRPYRPADVDFTHSRVYDSDTILSLKHEPKSIIIYGAGVIGCEYASIFRGLGCKVDLINGRDRLLSFMDAEMTDSLSYHFWNSGIVIRHNEEYDKIEGTEDGAVMTLKSGKRMKADCILFANGRTGNTDALNLEAVNLKANSRGSLAVDSTYKTSAENIYAVGDVIGYPSLASAAYDQGRIAADYMLGLTTERKLIEDIPTGIYTIPEMSSVGKTEQELTAAKIPYEVGRASFKHLARAQIGGSPIGSLKILFRCDTKEILGIHCFGERSAEIVHIGQAIMQQKGEANTIEYFVNTTFNYPTMAEAYRVAALNGLNRLF
jgi:NAD(P) transhydrogenase